MSDKGSILSVSFRVAAALVAVVGVALLFVPGVARGLGRPSEVAPWTLTRRDAPAVVRNHFLEDAGLRVTGGEWGRNRQQWSRMSDADRQELVRRLAQLQTADPDRRRDLVTRYQKLRELSGEARVRLRQQASALAQFEASLSREDMAVLESLPPKLRARHLVKLWRASRGLD